MLICRSAHSAPEKVACPAPSVAQRARGGSAEPHGRQRVLVFAKPWEGVRPRSVRRCEGSGRGLGEKGRTGRVGEPGRNRRREETKRTRPPAQAPYEWNVRRTWALPRGGGLSPCAHARRGLSGRSSVDIGRIPRRGSSRTGAVTVMPLASPFNYVLPVCGSEYTECPGRGTDDTMTYVCYERVCPPPERDIRSLEGSRMSRRFVFGRLSARPREHCRRRVSSLETAAVAPRSVPRLR